MNERIKELVLIAKHYANSDIFAENDVQLWQARYNEKFAELIVRECEKVAKGGSWYYDAPSCGWCNPINFVCNEMKEHFGVEE